MRNVRISLRFLGWDPALQPAIPENLQNLRKLTLQSGCLIPSNYLSQSWLTAATNFLLFRFGWKTRATSPAHPCMPMLAGWQGRHASCLQSVFL